ncbi:DUF5946 family protein [Chitiniphilus purpureus]|uniref:DUF5946 family protein n=1 Tax=Chitiniphilus purpureus TaxID=2981137 RepID=UPI0038CC16AF
MSPESKCPGCGAAFSDIAGPIHRYMHSSPACWAAFGEVLTREYSDPDYAAVHRLSVDAYAVQHPGDTSRQAIQSVGLHLVRLCFFLERGLPATEANAAMLKAGRLKANYIWLSRPAGLGDITVKDVVAAQGLTQHTDAVHAWARSAWHAWAEHHSLVRQWADAA